jgi:peroxiredoxin
VHREYTAQGLVVLAVNIKEGRGQVAAWTERHRLTVPVLLDPEGRITEAYRVTATPTVFLVGRDGRLVAKALGNKPWTSEQGQALLQLLLLRK